jgi:hypothetical protein
MRASSEWYRLDFRLSAPSGKMGEALDVRFPRSMRVDLYLSLALLTAGREDFDPHAGTRKINGHATSFSLSRESSRTREFKVGSQA